MEDRQPFGYPEEPDVYTICDTLLLLLTLLLFLVIVEVCDDDDDNGDDDDEVDDDWFSFSLFLLSDIIRSWVVNWESIRCWILLLLLLLLVVVAVAAATASITSFL